MFARDIMTKKVITVTPDTLVSDIARLLIENGISALPVVNINGEVIGMVSEGDLTGRGEIQRIERRDWWLAMFAEGEAISPEFIAEIKAQKYQAHEIMSTPVITVNESTDITEIAKILSEYHIKRVPVLRDNLIVGIISRADLVLAFANQNEQTIPQYKLQHNDNILAKYFHAKPKQQIEEIKPEETHDKLTAEDFQKLVKSFEHQRTLDRLEMQKRVFEQHKDQVDYLIKHHIDDANWHSMLDNAKEAAVQGKKESMVLRFPNQLCSDGGRAINVGDHGWVDTLRGEAAEIYLRWERELKPQGFRLSVRTVEYPNGFPGDIGMFLVWGN